MNPDSTGDDESRDRDLNWFQRTFLHPDDKHMWGMTLPLTIVVCLLAWAIQALT